MCGTLRNVHDEKVLTNLRKGALEYCTLALMRDSDAYGLDLARKLAKVGLISSEGSLYPLLSRLRKAGLVETHWQESPAGPPRRYYRITPTGTDALTEFEQTWRGFAHSVELALTGGIDE